MRVQSVVLPHRPPHTIWDVEIEHNKIISIQPGNVGRQNEVGRPSLLVPSLCHPHIHLDKPYLLTCNALINPVSTSASLHADGHPDYSDLIPSEGFFGEALSKTSEAKTRYTIPDLVLRGSQLVANSINTGVTHIRAFVEIDHVTNTKCIEAAITIKQQFKHLCHVQIVAFAQDPIFSTEYGHRNRQILEEVLDKYSNEIEVLGTTPYVERDFETGLKNVEWAIEAALSKNFHLDFHLDYNLDESKEAMVWDVIRILQEKNWLSRASNSKTIVLGHCTRMTLFSEDEMMELARRIQESKLPVHFVGLPTSDLFMMGRPSDYEPSTQTGIRQRGTLQVLDMIQKHGFDACLGVNNVGNAFTPWGNGDPLQLACLGVGIYQAGTEKAAEILYECISTRARKAIGLHDHTDDIEVKEGQENFLWIHNEDLIECVSYLKVKVPARQRLSIKDLVWDPPELKLRKLFPG